MGAKYLGTDVWDANLPTRLSTMEPSASFFWRYLNFVWSELSRGGAFLQSEAATKEIEDTLLALFVHAIDNSSGNPLAVDDTALEPVYYQTGRRVRDGATFRGDLGSGNGSRGQG